MATTNLGNIAIVPDGQWSNTKTYTRNRLVYHTNGNSYVARKDVPAGTAVTNDEYWQLSGARGLDGDVTTEAMNDAIEYAVAQSENGLQEQIDAAFSDIAGHNNRLLSVESESTSIRATQYGGTGVDSLDNLVDAIISRIHGYEHPIGSLYMSANSTSPSTLFGGTWERIEDTFLLAAGSTYLAGSAGGEATHTLTVDEMPAHAHKIARNNTGGTASSAYHYATEAGNYTNSEWNIDQTGGGQPHNNMPPYVAVYVWQRIA